MGTITKNGSYVIGLRVGFFAANFLTTFKYTAQTIEMIARLLIDSAGKDISPSSISPSGRGKSPVGLSDMVVWSVDEEPELTAL